MVIKWVLNHCGAVNFFLLLLAIQKTKSLKVNQNATHNSILIPQYISQHRHPTRILFPDSPELVKRKKGTDSKGRKGMDSKGKKGTNSSKIHNMWQDNNSPLTLYGRLNNRFVNNKEVTANAVDSNSLYLPPVDGIRDNSLLTFSMDNKPTYDASKASDVPLYPNYMDKLFHEHQLEFGGFYEGDMKSSEPQYYNDIHHQTWSSVDSPLGTSILWPDGLVPYQFSEDFDYRPLDKMLIEWTMKSIEEKSCVKFVKREEEVNFVKIVYDSYKCYSSVGKVGGEQALSLGMFCSLPWDRGNIYHELLHALGFYHEHTRPDRDNHVDVRWSNIKEGMAVNFNIDNRWNDELMNMPYDIESVMHYGSQAFSKLYFVFPTLVSKEKGVMFNRPAEPSVLDYEKLNRLYKCPTANRRRARLLSHTSGRGRSLPATGGSSALLTSLKNSLLFPSELMKRFRTARSDRIRRRKRKRFGKSLSKKLLPPVYRKTNHRLYYV